MEIVNKLDYVFTDEWFEPFIKQVLTKAGLNCDKVYLVDIEPYKRFYLDIDDCEYTIRAWNYFAMDHDQYGRQKGENSLPGHSQLSIEETYAGAHSAEDRGEYLGCASPD